jgi:uncharacterized protein DUF4333
MGRGARRGVAVGFGLWLAAAGGCSGSGSDGAAARVRQLERQIAAGLVTQLQVEVERVTCPDDARPTAPFRCTAAVDGEAILAIAVTPAAGDGGVAWATDGLVLRLDQLAGHVEAELAGLGLEARVDCGGRVRAGVPGDLIACAVDYPDGHRETATARIRDADGHFDLMMEGTAAAADADAGAGPDPDAGGAP